MPVKPENKLQFIQAKRGSTHGISMDHFTLEKLSHIQVFFMRSGIKLSYAVIARRAIDLYLTEVIDPMIRNSRQADISDALNDELWALKYWAEGLISTSEIKPISKLEAFPTFDERKLFMTPEQNRQSILDGIRNKPFSTRRRKRR